eukprot:3389342-Alexandrium_andersonii.AAC.1
MVLVLVLMVLVVVFVVVAAWATTLMSALVTGLLQSWYCYCGCPFHWSCDTCACCLLVAIDRSCY